MTNRSKARTIKKALTMSDPTFIEGSHPESGRDFRLAKIKLCRDLKPHVIIRFTIFSFALRAAMLIPRRLTAILHGFRVLLIQV